MNGDTEPINRRRTANSKTRKSRGCSVPSLIILLFLCIAVGGATAFVLLRLPVETERTFGPPSPALDTSRRLFYSAVLMVQAEKLTKPVDTYGATQDFSILPGESTPSIVDRLWREGLITDPAAFSTFLSYSGLDTGIQAGTYELSPTMTGIEIAHQLQDATPKDVAFQVIPGWRLEEIAAAIPTSGLGFSSEEFFLRAQVVPEGYFFSDNIQGGKGLEGFFLPGVYEIPRESSVDEFIKVILDAFETSVTEDLRGSIRRQGLNVYEAVTLASIVEREAMDEDEMPLIASVFYNRLEAGMKLDSDPTVQYAIGYNEDQDTWWTNPLSLTDLQFDSPYNTYIYAGLPPGPIANPSSAALRAVALPADTPYFYFRAACDGSGKHVFSETFEEHLSKSCP